MARSIDHQGKKPMVGWVAMSIDGGRWWIGHRASQAAAIVDAGWRVEKGSREVDRERERSWEGGGDVGKGDGTMEMHRTVEGPIHESEWCRRVTTMVDGALRAMGWSRLEFPLIGDDVEGQTRRDGECTGGRCDDGGPDWLGWWVVNVANGGGGEVMGSPEKWDPSGGGSWGRMKVDDGMELAGGGRGGVDWGRVVGLSGVLGRQREGEGV